MMCYWPQHHIHEPSVPPLLPLLLLLLSLLPLLPLLPLLLLPPLLPPLLPLPLLLLPPLPPPLLLLLLLLPPPPLLLLLPSSLLPSFPPFPNILCFLRRCVACRHCGPVLLFIAYSDWKLITQKTEPSTWQGLKFPNASSKMDDFRHRYCRGATGTAEVPQVL